MNALSIIIFLLNVLAIGGFSYFIYLRLNSSPVKKFYFPALLVKVACGMLLGLLYFYYYKNGDTVFYFQEATDLLSLPFGEYLKEVFLTSIPYEQRSTLPMIKITSLLLLVTGSNYWLAATYCSLFSFFGSFYFVYQLTKKYPEFKMAAVISFCFYPSVVFWSSGVLKESVVFGMIMFLSGIFLRYHFYRKVEIWHLLIAGVGAWLMIVIKYYIAAVFLPVFVIMLLVSLTQNNTRINNILPLYKYLGITFFIGVAVVWASSLQYNLNLTRLFSVIKYNQEQILAIGNSENAIRFLDESQSMLLVLPNLVIALLSGLFGPVFPQMTSFLQVMLCVENLMVLALFFTSLKRKIIVAADNKVLIYGVVFYILILTTLLPYSTPDFGTLIRYKVYFIPFFIMFVLYQNPFIFKPKTMVKK